MDHINNNVLSPRGEGSNEVQNVAANPLRAGLSWDTIGDFAIRHSRIVSIATPVILSNLITLALHSKESVELAPTIIALYALREAAMQRDGALVEYKVDIFGCFPCYAVSVGRVVLAGTTYLLRRDSRSDVRSLLERER